MTDDELRDSIHEVVYYEAVSNPDGAIDDEIAEEGLRVDIPATTDYLFQMLRNDAELIAGMKPGYEGEAIAWRVMDWFSSYEPRFTRLDGEL